MTTISPSARIRVATAIDSAVASHARRLMTLALPPGLRDDRFDGWPPSGTGGGAWSPPVGFVAALATDGGEPVGYLGGGLDRGHLRLDALIAPGPTRPASVLGELYTALLPAIEGSATAVVEVWGRPAEPWHHQLAADRGLAETRALHQMRCRLPVAAEALPTRAYVAHDDLEALRLLNNRAFATHPDQGNLSADDLLATMSEPWFLPEGLRLHERDGRLAGFCWTKVHRRASAASGDDLGEIYIIGVDPEQHGRGLGVPMTAAGLHWLAQQGLASGMLYVEAGNEPAMRTYQRLGFSIVRTDRAWSIDTAAARQQPLGHPPQADVRHRFE